MYMTNILQKKWPRYFASTPFFFPGAAKSKKDSWKHLHLRRVTWGDKPVASGPPTLGLSSQHLPAMKRMAVALATQQQVPRYHCRSGWWWAMTRATAGWQCPVGLQAQAKIVTMWGLTTLSQGTCPKEREKTTWVGLSFKHCSSLQLTC